jgi:hypothetical protein
LDVAEVIFFLVVEDKRKQFIGYVAMACTTDLISTSLAAPLSSFWQSVLVFAGLLLSPSSNPTGDLARTMHAFTSSGPIDYGSPCPLLFW